MLKLYGYITSFFSYINMYMLKTDIPPTSLPNLNSPAEDFPFSSKATYSKPQDNILSPNKFDILHENLNELQHSSSTSMQLESIQIPPPSQQKASRSKQAKKAPSQTQKSQ
ncbi:hypothetical protein KFK09_017498 [Dendrobium nobile]|uniref:Uncharacterized protein n=1 Tax=Dendrobium nobile TaxID=94219 RepID=A0A8T3B7J0_DENNO|nr:hypothetical protein KFK09_017498 [Dendrobium nobile]